MLPDPRVQLAAFVLPGTHYLQVSKACDIRHLEVRKETRDNAKSFFSGSWFSTVRIDSGRPEYNFTDGDTTCFCVHKVQTTSERQKVGS